MTDRKDIAIDAVYDIETERWERFVMGGVYYADGSYDVFDASGADAARSDAIEREFADALLAIRGSLWAHYGGGFDHKWLLDHAARQGYKGSIAAAGSRIIFAKLGKLTLADSFAVAPISLADFTRGLGVSKGSLGLPCLGMPHCGTECEGHCQIRRAAPPDIISRIKAYLELDCRSLFGALAALREFAATADLDLRKTVGSSSWTHAQRLLGLPDADLSPGAHSFARQGYYGGRVQVFRHGWVPMAYEYDVRSMYPWALNANALPVGTWCEEHGTDAAESFGNERPGIYRCVVSVPDSFIPPLPMRTKKRIYYPVGTFRGEWALPELLYAVRECGAEVLSVSDALSWSDERVVFRDWTERLFHVRHKETPQGPDSPLGIFCKFYANSLTGKLGMQPERWQYYLNPSDIKTCTTPEICGDECAGKCGSMGQISEYIWRARRYALSGCMHVAWAAYLTSHSRIKLHRQLVSGGADDACYCDTDSVYSLLRRHDDLGDALGQFEFKGQRLNMHFVAPKVYEYDEAESGKHKVRTKGIRRPTKIVVGAEYSREGIAGFSKGARSDRLFYRTETKRTINARLGDRIIIDSEGMTRPMTVAEAVADSKRR